MRFRDRCDLRHASHQHARRVPSGPRPLAGSALPARFGLWFSSVRVDGGQSCVLGHRNDSYSELDAPVVAALPFGLKPNAFEATLELAEWPRADMLGGAGGISDAAGFVSGASAEGGGTGGLCEATSVMLRTRNTSGGPGSLGRQARCQRRAQTGGGQTGGRLLPALLHHRISFCR